MIPFRASYPVNHCLDVTPVSRRLDGQPELLLQHLHVCIASRESNAHGEERVLGKKSDFENSMNLCDELRFHAMLA